MNKYKLDILAKNLLADKNCNNCKFDIKSVHDICVLTTIATPKPIENTCENWKSDD